MKKATLTLKLRTFLQDHPVIQVENELVYLLVQARRIMDASAVASQYPTLYFYCNWTLHHQLDHRKTTSLIKNKFAQVVDPNKSAKTNAAIMRSQDPDFFKLTDLKNDLQTFFVDHQLALDLSGNRWAFLAKLLLETNREIPILFDEKEEIVRLEIIPRKDGSYCYKFTLRQSRNKPIIILKFKRI